MPLAAGTDVNVTAAGRWRRCWPKQPENAAPRCCPRSLPPALRASPRDLSEHATKWSTASGPPGPSIAAARNLGRILHALKLSGLKDTLDERRASGPPTSSCMPGTSTRTPTMPGFWPRTYRERQKPPVGPQYGQAPLLPLARCTCDRHLGRRWVLPVKEYESQVLHGLNRWKRLHCRESVLTS